MGELVGTLERRGYVERVVDPDDARGRLVRLTEKGRWAVRLAVTQIADIEAEWLERYRRAGFDVDVRALLEAGVGEREAEGQAPGRPASRNEARSR